MVMFFYQRDFLSVLAHVYHALPQNFAILYTGDFWRFKEVLDVFRCSLLIVFVILHRVYARDFSRVLFFFCKSSLIVLFSNYFRTFFIVLFCYGVVKMLAFFWHKSSIYSRDSRECVGSLLDSFNRFHDAGDLLVFRYFVPPTSGKRFSSAWQKFLSKDTSLYTNISTSHTPFSVVSSPMHVLVFVCFNLI